MTGLFCSKALKRGYFLRLSLSGIASHDVRVPEKNPAAERAVRDETDAELVQRGEHVLPTRATTANTRSAPALIGCTPLRAPQRRFADLGESEILHLAGFHELAHRADGFFDRHLRIERDADNTDRSHRRRAARAMHRTRRARAGVNRRRLARLARRRPGPLPPPPGVTKPNFVAICTRSRTFASACPTKTSFFESP